MRRMSRLRVISATLAALLLALMAGSLGNSRRDMSTVGLWLRGPERPGSSHPRPLPLDIYRTPRGIEVVAAGSAAPESGALLDVQLTTATRERRGFLFPTRETSEHKVWGAEALSERERGQLVRAAVASLREQNMGEMVSEQLDRGELSRSRVLFSGYALDAGFGALSLLVLWQFAGIVKPRFSNQQRPAPSASLR